MSGAHLRGRDLSGEQRLTCEAVVVGTGAGGGMVARDLAAAGLDVVVLEMGPHLGPAGFTMREEEMLEALFQERGARATADGEVRILQGCGVGGSTVHNTNLCKRTPEVILDHWARDFAVRGCSARELEPAFAATEAELNVRPMGPAQLNRHNALFKEGVEALGYAGGFLSHNRNDGCVGSGFCELGCPFDGKQNALKVLVPRAIELGARVYSEARVERVRTRAGRATGVQGSFLAADGRTVTGSFVVDAKVVVLAGSAIGSAALHLASGLDDPSGQAGKNLRVHPGAVVAAVFDEEVRGWQGIPQVYECTELLDLSPGSTRRVWLLPGFAHPIGVATMIPGFGRTHADAMRDYARTAAVIALVHDHSAGRVRMSGSRIRIDYAPDADDRAQLAVGLREGARILLAAGARRVVVPYETDPLVIEDPARLAEIDARGAPEGSMALTAVHPMGTLRMGDDPTRAVVSSQGEHHAVKGLFVADGSLFPTSLGIPPQLSIFAFARHLAPHVAAAARA